MNPVALQSPILQIHLRRILTNLDFRREEVLRNDSQSVAWFGQSVQSK
jgi:hypothetical protein